MPGDEAIAMDGKVMIDAARCSSASESHDDGSGKRSFYPFAFAPPQIALLPIEMSMAFG